MSLLHVPKDRRWTSWLVRCGRSCCSQVCCEGRTGCLLAEGLHRALLESLLAQGRNAEVVEAYERLASLLRAELGVEPSRATQAVVARGML